MAQTKLDEIKNNKVLKASTWYIICSFATNALTFITAPIFTRIMPKSAYGEYSNFVSWYGIIGCLATLNLEATLMRARYDFKNEFKSYAASMLLLGTTNALLLYVIVLGFQSTFGNIFHLSIFYISLIFVCQIFQPANGIFQTMQRLEYRYKTSVFLTLTTAVFTSLISVILVLNWNDKLLAKVVGAQVPALIINIGLYGYFLWQGKKIRWRHWKYAYVIALPYVPHLLAGNMLSSLDRVMLTDLRGAEETATYSVAGNCMAIMSIFSNSISLAIQPWIAEKLHKKEYVEIRKMVNIAFVLFTLICSYLIIFGKEIIFILGGEKYSNAVAVIPPLVIGCLYQFIYTFYAGVEQFEKKTVGMAAATLIAALLNWGLNGMFIPHYGYTAAAYTTLASYFFLLLMHYFLVRRLKMQNVFDTKMILCLIAAICIFSKVVEMLNNYVRYGLIFIITGAIIYIGLRLLKVVKKREADV